MRHGTVEGFDLLAPQYEAAHRSIGTLLRRFDAEEDALAWLREVLQQAGSDAAA